jgi:5-deoxy-glucuronate isomerase
MSTTEPSLFPITNATCVVRNTAGQRGRHWFVTPGATAARHLHYGRINLRAGDEALTFNTAGRETGLIALAGEAAIETGGATYRLTPYDALYLPRGVDVRVSPGSGGCDLAEVASPVERVHPVQFVPFKSVQNDPGLRFAAGSPGAKREVNILLGKNVQAGRVMAGVTFSEPGNWTSWPPHEHAVLAEEAYLYINMPPPSFGVQFVYTNPTDPELATIVREGDIVLMPQGYHPNVAAPGGTIGFLWMMAATREDVDRQFGVVNVQPEFAQGGSGLDPGRSDKK